ncbi:hypothetical protein N9N67_07875 [Bacteriovoracaceae bacterium]|nr:hypothetical protein [Bacteriovoracaceae bacterium]
MFKSFIILLCLSQFILSCQEDTSGPGNSGSSDNTPDECSSLDSLCLPETETRELPDLPDFPNKPGQARQYYEQFLLKKENVSDDPDFPEYIYRFLGNGLAKKVEINGKKYSITYTLGLNKDGSYKGKYQEFYHPNEQDFYLHKCIELRGEWDVHAGDLLIFHEGFVFSIGQKSQSDFGATVLFSNFFPLSLQLPIKFEIEASLAMTNVEGSPKVIYECADQEPWP